MTQADRAKKAIQQVAKEAGLAENNVKGVGDAFGNAIRNIAHEAEKTNAERGKMAATAAEHEVNVLAADIDDPSALYYFYKELAEWAQSEADSAELGWQ